MIKYICPYCKNVIERKITIKNNELFCSKCGEWSLLNHVKGICTECGKKTKKMPIKMNKITGKLMKKYFWLCDGCSAEGIIEILK